MRDLGFESWLFKLDTGSPTARHLLECFFSVVQSFVGQALSRGDEPCHSLRISTKYEKIMKIFLENLFALPNDARTC